MDENEVKYAQRNDCMSARRNYNLILLFAATLFALPAYAGQQPGCDETVAVKHHGDEPLNEVVLQKHFDQIKNQMNTIRHSRGPHVDRILALRRHLSQMRDAMQMLHDQMYLSGCRTEKQGVSLGVRVEAMEKQLKYIHQILSQVIDHLSESEADITSQTK